MMPVTALCIFLVGARQVSDSPGLLQRSDHRRLCKLLAAIIVGAVAGWLAEKITGSNMGLITNIILGMIGAALGSFLFAKFGVQVGGPDWFVYLVAGFVGACILILLTRIIAPSRWR